MTTSMYQASAPRFVSALRNLSAILDGAQAYSETKKIDPSALLGARLYPDTFPLKRQVQAACDTAKGAVARLAGIEVPRHEDTEETIAELQARIEKTVTFVETVKAAQIDGSEERNIHFKLGVREVDWKGIQYLLGYAVPNFYFHVTAACDILRHTGILLARRDYIGSP